LAEKPGGWGDVMLRRFLILMAVLLPVTAAAETYPS
jgi:hypothetical protein